VSLTYDPHDYPYPSRRSVTYGRNGMVATSQSLAAQAGLQILKEGGNAVDAVIAAAACLTVVEPTSNGIGSDAFALVWFKGQLFGLNASGPAPQSLTIEAVKAAGHDQEMPPYGLIPVTVPGAPGAWAALSGRFGKLPLQQVFAPAIRYAEEGFPVSPVVASNWKKAFALYKNVLKGEEFQPWFDTFAPAGRAPHAGEIWRSPDHAASLRLIAETNAEAFYRGELAEKIDAFFRKYGGFLRKEDLWAYTPEWVDPICIHYRGYDVWEIPPNGQGLVALHALNILKGWDFAYRDCPETYHRQIEAMKLAYVDGMKYISQMSEMTVSVEELLSERYAAERRALIGEEAIMPEAGNPPGGGTVYLAAADGEGNMVSYIQSNYQGFGSGIVIPGTGIALQNRGLNFSLQPDHVNALKPGKKTFHTIIPGFLTKGRQAVGPFGVMGSYMQPQGHVQVIMNTIDFHLNPQAALDAPRWMWSHGKTVKVESAFPQEMARALARKGHDIQVELNVEPFGRGQIIWRDPETGVLAGATDPRTDGAVVSW